MKKILFILAGLFILNTTFAQTHNDVLNSALGQTTNATQTLLFSIPVSDSASQFWNLEVTCRRRSDGATKTWSFSGSFKRNKSGAVVASSELLKIGGISGDKLALALTAVVVDANSTDGLIYVYGLLSTDMYWFGKIYGDELIDN